jgi:hypothetical protein
MLITIDQGFDSSFHEAATVALGCKTMFPTAAVWVTGRMGGLHQMVGVQLDSTIDQLCEAAEQQLAIQQFPIQVDIEERDQTPGPYDIYPTFDQDGDDDES